MQEEATSLVPVALRQVVAESLIPLDAWAIRLATPVEKLKNLLDGSTPLGPEYRLPALRLLLTGRTNSARDRAIATLATAHRASGVQAPNILGSMTEEIRARIGIRHAELCLILGDRFWTYAMRLGSHVDVTRASAEADALVAGNTQRHTQPSGRLLIMRELLDMAALSPERNAAARKEYLEKRSAWRRELADSTVVAQQSPSAPAQARNVVVLLQELRECSLLTRPDISLAIEEDENWFKLRVQRLTRLEFDHISAMRRILEIPRIQCFPPWFRHDLERAIESYEHALVRAQVNFAFVKARRYRTTVEAERYGESELLPVGLSFRDPEIAREIISERVPLDLRAGAEALIEEEDHRLLAQSRARAHELREMWFAENEASAPETSPELVEVGIELAILLDKARKIARLSDSVLRKNARIDKTKARKFFSGLTGDFPELLEVAVAFRQVCAPHQELDDLIGQALTRAYTLTDTDPVEAIPLHVSPYARPLGKLLRAARKASGFPTLELASSRVRMTKGRLQSRESGDFLDSYPAMLDVWQLLDVYQPIGELYECLDRALADQTDWLHAQRFKELVHTAEKMGYTADDQTRVLAVLTRATRLGLQIGHSAMVGAPISYGRLRRIEAARAPYTVADYEFLQQLHGWLARTAGAQYTKVSTLLTHRQMPAQPPQGERNAGRVHPGTSPNFAQSPNEELYEPEYVLYEADIRRFRELREALGIGANPSKGPDLSTIFHRLANGQPLEPSGDLRLETDSESLNSASGTPQNSVSAESATVVEKKSVSQTSNRQADAEPTSAGASGKPELSRDVPLPRFMVWPELPSVDPKLGWSQVARLFRLRSGLPAEQELSEADLAQVSDLDGLPHAELCQLANGHGNHVSEKTIRTMLAHVTPSSGMQGLRNSWQTWSLRPQKPASVYAHLLRGLALSLDKHQAQGPFFFQRVRPHFSVEQQRSSLRLWRQVVHGESGSEELEAFRLALTNILVRTAASSATRIPSEPAVPESAEFTAAESVFETATVNNESDSELAWAELMADPEIAALFEVEATSSSPENANEAARQRSLELIVNRMGEKSRELTTTGLGYTIAELIAEGALPPGSCVVGALRLDTHLNGHKTGRANRAFAILGEAGLLESIRNKGSFITSGNHDDAVGEFLARLPPGYSRDPQEPLLDKSSVAKKLDGAESEVDEPDIWRQVGELAKIYMGFSADGDAGELENIAREFELAPAAVRDIFAGQAAPDVVEVLLERVNTVTALSSTLNDWPVPLVGRTPHRAFGILLRGYACRFHLSPAEVYRALRPQLAPTERDEVRVTRWLAGLVAGSDHPALRRVITQVFRSEERHGGLTPASSPFPLSGTRMRTFLKLLESRGTHYAGWVESDWPVLATELLTRQQELGEARAAYSRRLQQGHGYDTYGDLRQASQLVAQLVPSDAELLARLREALRRQELRLDVRTRLEMTRAAEHFPGWATSSWLDVAVLCRKIRAKHHIDIETVATELGCLPAHVKRWEAGAGYRNTTMPNHPYASDVELTLGFLDRWPADTPDWPADETEVRAVREFLNQAVEDPPYQTYYEWLLENARLPEPWEEMVLEVFHRRADMHYERQDAEISWGCRLSALKALEEGRIPETEQQISQARAIVIGAGLQELWAPALASVHREPVLEEPVAPGSRLELVRELVACIRQNIVESPPDAASEVEEGLEPSPAEAFELEPDELVAVSETKQEAEEITKGTEEKKSVIDKTKEEKDREKRTNILAYFEKLKSGELTLDYGVIEYAEEISTSFSKAQQERIRRIGNALRGKLYQDFEASLPDTFDSVKQSLLSIHRAFAHDPFRADLVIEQYYSREKAHKRWLARRRLGDARGMRIGLLQLLGNAYGWGEEITQHFPVLDAIQVPGMKRHREPDLDVDSAADLGAVLSSNEAVSAGAAVSNSRVVAIDYEEDDTPNSLPCTSPKWRATVRARWRPEATEASRSGNTPRR